MRRSLAVVAFAVLGSSSAVAQIAIHPVEVDLREKRVATISLTNQGEHPKTFEVSLDESAGVIFSPRVFVVEAGKTRRIKYAIKEPVKSGEQRFARTAINDISPATPGLAIETRISGSLPVFVGNGKPEFQIVGDEIKNVGAGTARVTMVDDRRMLVYVEPGQVIPGAKPGQRIFVNNEPVSVQ